MEGIVKSDSQGTWGLRRVFYPAPSAANLPGLNTEIFGTPDVITCWMSLKMIFRVVFSSIFWLQYPIYFHHNLSPRNSEGMFLHTLCKPQSRSLASRPQFWKLVLFSYRENNSDGPQDRDWYSHALSQDWKLRKIKGFFMFSILPGEVGARETFIRYMILSSIYKLRPSRNFY